MSSSNMEYNSLKLALLVLKGKNNTKTLSKLKNSPHASACRKIGPQLPTLRLCVMIRDVSSYLQMLKTSVAVDGDLIPGPFCALLELQTVLARKSATNFC